MAEGMRHWANPSSPHAEGRKARALLEDARARIKVALNWEGELIFTSGASEALALGLHRAKTKRRLVSAVEHEAVFRATPDADTISLLDGDIAGDVLHRELERGPPAVIAVQSVNSETGTILWPETALPGLDTIRAHGSLLLRDCSQSAGKFALPVGDMVVISAHKFGGPIGIGALLVRDFALLEPVGGHERGYRQGTENLPGALGMAAALEVADMDGWPTTAEERLDFKQGLMEFGEVIQPGYHCSHIFAVAHRTMSAQAQLIRLDAMGFAVSAGSACSSGTLRKSRVLEGFGIDDATASRTIRVSLGWTTTKEELDRFIEAWSGLSS
ncbi:cysteine desulfurase family protein [Qipengyuania sp.]|uniref:cysteine desulfurase family protein n=1 Tax=Qipengyuania sp. TaxID=2004515 RepID=UPI0035C8729A